MCRGGLLQVTMNVVVVIVTSQRTQHLRHQKKTWLCSCTGLKYIEYTRKEFPTKPKTGIRSNCNIYTGILKEYNLSYLYRLYSNNEHVHQNENIVL